MLLDARKVPWLERAYARYGRRLLGNAFARVWVGGAAWPDDDRPTIAFLNHSAWWDPVLTLFLSHGLFRRDGYGIMQGAQLARYPFFRRVGCFGATGEGIDDARAVTEYAARVLRGGPRRTLWIFPQGELLPARAPLAFRSGVARIARAVPEARLVPLAVRYELRAAQRPEIFVRVGEPVLAASSERGAERSFALVRRLELRMRQELALLDEALTHAAPAGYTAVLDGRGSLSALYDRTFGRWGGGRRASAER
jgi:chlorobactene lauroyltransferase